LIQHTFEAVLRERQTDGELVHLEVTAARSAQHAMLEALSSVPNFQLSGDGLWTHQVQAIESVLTNQSIVVATGTASGKTLCYQLPLAIAAASEKPAPTALLLFPTKALAQDQLRSLGALSESLGLRSLAPMTVTRRRRPVSGHVNTRQLS
jgi:DEAD/DEAH box helicase domain-containing protein